MLPPPPHSVIHDNLHILFYLPQKRTLDVTYESSDDEAAPLASEEVIIRKKKPIIKKRVLQSPPPAPERPLKKAATVIKTAPKPTKKCSTKKPKKITPPTVKPPRPSPKPALPPELTYVPPKKEFLERAEKVAQTTNELPAGTVVDTLDEKDVLCGRGSTCSFHPGNYYFRELARERKAQYRALPRSKRTYLAEEVVAGVRERGGRFLEVIEDPNDLNAPKSYRIAGRQRIWEKTCQALRDRKW